MSNCYPVNKCYGDKKECHHGGGHHHHGHHSHVDCKPNKTIFRCRETNSTTLSLVIPSTAPSTPITSGEQTLATIKVKDLCCFKNPCVKINNISNSIIASNTSSARLPLTLTYQLYRKCEHDRDFKAVKSPITLNLSIANGARNLILPQQQSFCDCEESCERNCCCVYELRVTASTTYPSGATPAGTLTVNIAPGTISVIAGEENC